MIVGVWSMAVALWQQYEYYYTVTSYNYRFNPLSGDINIPFSVKIYNIIIILYHKFYLGVKCGFSEVNLAYRYHLMLCV